MTRPAPAAGPGHPWRRSGRPDRDRPPVGHGAGRACRLGDIYSSMGTGQWRRPCGGEPWRFWKSRTTSAPRRYGPGWALRVPGI